MSSESQNAPYPRTLYDKLFDRHIVTHKAGEDPLIYINRHYIHEVTSPQAFEGLRERSLPVRRPERTIATMDHNISTKSRAISASSPLGQQQLEALKENCKDFGIKIFDEHSDGQGIVHVMGPEEGLTLPGMTVVCGDSHTATHGAFGALAFGIGTSEVEHVLATQTLQQPRAKTMKVELRGSLPPHLSAKDLILSIIARVGTAGGTGYAIEFCGQAITDLGMEGRMTLCNMAIEMGAKAGMIAPDETTYRYLKDRRYAPHGQAWEAARRYWDGLKSDENAAFDKVVTLSVDEITPQVSWGTNPGQTRGINDVIPNPQDFEREDMRLAAQNALQYMDLKPGQAIESINIDHVFIGSCTNARIEDLRAAASIVKGRKKDAHVRAMVVPGSIQVRRQAEDEGLDQIFTDAGFEWRLPGCSMCLAMNDDKLAPGDRCASTSNRNFEGRQGRASRTHLVSPAMAAAAGIFGHFVDIRKLTPQGA